MEIKERVKETSIKDGDNPLANEENEKGKKQVRNGKTRHLPEKEFKLRNSLLTDLFEKNPHVQTIYHIALATFMSIFVTKLAQDYFKEKRFNLGTRLILGEFRQIHIALTYWCLYNLGSLLFFYLFKLWATIRMNHLPPKVKYLRIWDSIALFTCLLYYFFSFLTASSAVSKYRLSITNASIVCIDQVRLLMKFHSFWRYNCEKVLKYKSHSEQKINLPTLNKFIYFLFAPTMLYRDNYPRINGIRWTFIAQCLIEFVMVIFAFSFAVEALVYPSLGQYVERRQKWEEIFLASLYNSAPAIMIYLTMFYLVLHVTQNLFAELLCFGDRLYYEDWWNCTGFLSFFRSWNIVVGDWLYTYIYRDVYQFVIPNKSVAKLTVFLISAVVHELLLSCIFNFFLPVLFIQMILSGFLALVKSPRSRVLNVLLWFALFFFTGVNVTIYGLEYNLRLLLPVKNSWKHFFHIYFLSESDILLQ